MKIKISIVVIALLAGIGFLAISSVKKETRKFYQLNEFQDALKKDEHVFNDKFLIVLGNVKEGTIKKSGIQADFTMEMNEVSLKVHHNGKNLLPDTFQDGAQVTVEGKYNSEKKEFVSEKVMAKCASTYSSGQTPVAKEGVKVK